MCAVPHSTAATEVRDWRLTLVVGLLCMSLWRGPIPVVHRHVGAESADVTWRTFWGHWTAFHSRSADDVPAEEWHVHFSFPWTFADGGAGSDSCPIPAPQESDAAALSLASSGELPAFSLTAPSPVSESIVFDAGRASLPDVLRCREGGGFLKSYSPAAPLCIVTGVVLC